MANVTNKTHSKEMLTWDLYVSLFQYRRKRCGPSALCNLIDDLYLKKAFKDENRGVKLIVIDAYMYLQVEEIFEQSGRLR